MTFVNRRREDRGSDSAPARALSSDVEQRSELDFLCAQRCGRAQGVLLVRPRDRDATAELLSRSRLDLLGLPR